MAFKKAHVYRTILLRVERDNGPLRATVGTCRPASLSNPVPLSRAIGFFIPAGSTGSLTEPPPSRNLDPHCLRA